MRHTSKTNYSEEIKIMDNKIKLNWNQIDAHSIELNSPYAVYAGETMVKILPQNYSRRVDLRELQAQIIYAINHFLVLTSRMITSYLNYTGYDVEQRKVQKELAFLSDNCYLNKYEFRSTESTKSSFKCYTIGNKGNGFLKAMTGLRGQKLGYLDQCTPVQVKRILASNQALIELNMMRNAEVGVAKMVTDEGFHLLDNKYLFRASGYVENEDAITIIEPVRNEPDSIDTMLKKLRRMDKTLGREKCNVDASKKITVVIVAESLVKMENLMNIIEENDYKHFSIEYTYDTLLYSDTEHKLYKKAKDIKNVELLIAV